MKIHAVPFGNNREYIFLQPADGGDWILLCENGDGEINARVGDSIPHAQMEDWAYKSLNLATSKVHGSFVTLARMEKE